MDQMVCCVEKEAAGTTFGELGSTGVGGGGVSLKEDEMREVQGLSQEGASR